MFNIESLMNIAAEAEKRYLELSKDFPPGTYNKERNDKYQEREDALTCAMGMEQLMEHGINEIANIGPFHSFEVSNEECVQIRRGSVVHSAKGDSTLVRIQKVVVHSVDSGHVCNGKIINGKIHWAGTKGYWKWTDINNVVK